MTAGRGAWDPPKPPARGARGSRPPEDNARHRRAIVFACSLLAFSRLHISAESNELFSHKVEFFRNWLEFNKLFPENEATYVVVDESINPSGVPPTARWTALADAIAAKLRAMPQAVKSVDERIPLDQLGKQGILFEDPKTLRHEIGEARELAQLAHVGGSQSRHSAARTQSNFPIPRRCSSGR